MTTAELDFLVGRLRQRAAERPESPTVREMRDGFDELANFLPTPADARVEPVDAGGGSGPSFGWRKVATRTRSPPRSRLPLAAPASAPAASMRTTPRSSRRRA